MSASTAAAFRSASRGDPPLARIIGLVDYYDELLHPRNSATPAAPSQAISQLYKLSQKKFDQDLVKLLIKVLGVYPPGSLVMLSDDSVALVLSTEPTMPLKPGAALPQGTAVGRGGDDRPAGR